MRSSRYRRVLGMEALETRALMSAVPLPASVPPVVAGDTVIPVHAQVGSTALETILGVAAKLDTIEEALDAYLNQIPGWHLTGGIDNTPSYSGMVDGSVVLGSNGLLKSATMALTGSADIAATIEGYYGTGVLHVGLGAAADLSANVSATASFSVATNTWNFGGSASLVGYVKGYATAMAWPLKGEVYIQGNAQAAAAISSQSGIASASVVLAGSVGAKAQLKSLLGGWTTIASASRNLGAWQGSASFNVGAWMRSETVSVVGVYRVAVAQSFSAASSVKSAAPNLGAGTAVSPTMAPYAAANPRATFPATPNPSGAQASGTSLEATANRSALNATASQVAVTADPAFVLVNAVSTSDPSPGLRPDLAS